MPASSAYTVHRHSYGDDESQYGELYLPAGDRRPGTVVVIHGGFWKARYGAEWGAPLAADLAVRGWAAWNLEYRRVGNGGGWPATLTDVAAGIDALADLQASAGLDTGRVVALGHSAGGHLAAWAAGRPVLPADAVGAAPRVRLTGVIAQAGVLDLARGAADQLGSGAVPALLGGMPADRPERYRLASPREQLPVPVRCLHARDDDVVPFSQSADYVAAARAAGADAGLVEVPGGHFGVIDPAAPAWQAALDLLPDLLDG
ncbi:alpha/beta hydrolase family protein [Jatrophihabitans sp.]|uniref:alpha/beta hydrolase family protein n=1 Tax=Jatrophihabitans sp. TaxID=1932789 RepID=UPI002C0C9C7B|nr:alpha/beta hydrolase [Jatrophihabitans sp.]